MPFSVKNLVFPEDKKEDIKPSFEENVKNSFQRAKEHINALENELKANKAIIIKQNEQISSILEQIKVIKDELSIIKTKIRNNEGSSTGNQGVYSDIHSFNKQLFIQQVEHKIEQKHQDRPLMAIHASREKLREAFMALSRQELLTFLTIYQLEEDNGHVTYMDVAKHLNLSEGCIRTYISSLAKKGIPLVKVKHNNKQVFLSVPKELKDLSLKGELMSMYYGPFSQGQKTLHEHF